MLTNISTDNSSVEMVGMVGIVEIVGMVEMVEIVGMVEMVEMVEMVGIVFSFLYVYPSAMI